MSQPIESVSLHGGMLRVGDLAKRTGKTVRAIHLYEELGLLKPATRSSGGFRLYEEAAVDRVRWIDLLHGMGFSLHEMREVLRAWWGAEVGPEAMSRLRELFETKLEETRQAIERGKKTEAELLAGLAYLETCKVCPTHEPSTGCVRCTQDHGMKTRPSLVAGITSAPQGRGKRIGKELDPR
ncbi:MAG TPA: MerR family transcriptional regulator [Candidatus Eisenbacteria bacterium]|nr:MerR family transcriptional regulator [Candidatus Eisenbacteria bacterium]